MVYMRSDVCDTGTEVACNDDTPTCGTSDGCTASNDHHGSAITPTVTAGQTYFIIVDGFNGSCGGDRGNFALTVVAPGGTPPTTTTTSTSTSTTSTTVPCGLDGNTQTCGGDCPAGSTCAFDPVQSACGCTADKDLCGSQVVPACASGLCPGVAQTCQVDLANNDCSCQ